MEPVAVIGGGLAGISCALHLAEHGIDTELFEAAPRLGGRTSSFHDEAVDAWVDNGPHLLIGAYRHARAFFARHGVTQLAWQPHLTLPLWDAARGHFALRTRRWLPLPWSLAWASARLPGHGLQTLLAMRRLGMAMHRPVPQGLSVDAWIAALDIPPPLTRDLLHPLCLGAMNEAAAHAPVASFAHVLREAFADHDGARLGWFTAPFAQALVAPLEQAMQRHGVRIHLSTRVSALQAQDGLPAIRLRSGKTRRFGRVVLAMPAHARNRLLGVDRVIETRPITNVHLWFDEDLHLPHPLIGGIGTLGHWFFDIGRQMPGIPERYRHVCAVVSADSPGPSQDWTTRLCDELGRMLGRRSILQPRHVRIVHEQRATTLVRAGARPMLPDAVHDAGEQPQPGDLPATIETAVMRGMDTAARILSTHGR
jgi:squalene-associated FAD-dependent desaturase